MPKKDEWRGKPSPATSRPKVTGVPTDRQKSISIHTSYTNGQAETPANVIASHSHRWGGSAISGGVLTPRCIDCGYTEFIDGRQPTSGATGYLDGLQIRGIGTMSHFADHGGFMDYNPLTMEIHLNDGSIVSFEEVLRSNPTVSAAGLEYLLKEALTQVRKAALSPDPWAGPEVQQRISNISERVKGLTEAFELGHITAEAAAEGFRKLVGAPPLELKPQEIIDAVVADIKADSDPFSAGGAWLSKLTIKISDAIREDEDPQDG